MTWPLCTIVIPAYNAGAWIERTLRSAAQQTYPNLEVLVVDDGSTDNTLALAKAVAAVDDRFRVLSIPNGGVARARNLGIREARGEFVAFLDADDLWHPKKIDLQVAAMQGVVDGVQPGASYTLMRTIDVNDRVTGTGNMLALSGFMLARHLYFKPVGNGSSMLVRREVALELGGFDPTWAARGIGGCEDLDFELKVAAKYPIVAVPLFLIGYRISPGNMSSNRLALGLGYIGVVERHVMANPQLPEWVTRLIYGTSLDLSRQLLANGRHWRESFQHLSRQFKYEPEQATKVMLKRIFSYEPKRAIRFLRKAGGGIMGRTVQDKETGNAAPPLFSEVGPEVDPAQRAAWLSPREQNIMSALTEVDVQLWSGLRSVEHQSMVEDRVRV